jgi:hypothetical protein
VNRELSRAKSDPYTELTLGPPQKKWNRYICSLSYIVVWLRRGRIREYADGTEEALMSYENENLKVCRIKNCPTLPGPRFVHMNEENVLKFEYRTFVIEENHIVDSENLIIYVFSKL